MKPSNGEITNFGARVAASNTVTDAGAPAAPATANTPAGVTRSSSPSTRSTGRRPRAAAVANFLRTSRRQIEPSIVSSPEVEPGCYAADERRRAADS
ncbi:hypothetical protein [Urbifossiella limnaea]|uniref:hypothetical protein n=1 Tax=Urbifossiella limnaea TaxID=2528023 RepID=UPI00192E6AC1|nr:hypothetical protein [Urbifossiella limnaea]